MVTDPLQVQGIKGRGKSEGRREKETRVPSPKSHVPRKTGQFVPCSLWLPLRPLAIVPDRAFFVGLCLHASASCSNVWYLTPAPQGRSLEHAENAEKTKRLGKNSPFFWFWLSLRPLRSLREAALRRFGAKVGFSFHRSLTPDIRFSDQSRNPKYRPSTTLRAGRRRLSGRPLIPPGRALGTENLGNGFRGSRFFKKCRVFFKNLKK